MTTLTKRQARMLSQAARSAPATVLMTEEEARQVVTAYRDSMARAEAHLTSARAMLLDLHDREGWRALGYANWRACAVAELGLSQAHVYRLLTAAEVERDIRPVLIDFSHDEKNIPETVLRPIAQLDSPEERQAAARSAIEAAGGGVPTATQTQQAVNAIRPPDSTADTFTDATQRFAALGWRLERHGLWFKLSQADGSHYATTQELAPQLATLATLEQATARVERPDLIVGQRTDPHKPDPKEPPPPTTTDHVVPDNLRVRAEALGLTIQPHMGGLLLCWPWEDPGLYAPQTPTMIHEWLRDDALTQAIVHAERLGWQLRPYAVADQQLYACVRARGSLSTAGYADELMAWGEALRIEVRNWRGESAPADASPTPAPPCEDCGAPSTNKRSIRGTLANRCDACAIRATEQEQADRAEVAAQSNDELAKLCERAEALGAQVNYLATNDPAIVRVVAPPGYQQRPLDYDVDELRKQVEAWERPVAPSAPASSPIDWNAIARESYGLGAAKDTRAAWRYVAQIMRLLCQEQPRALAARLLHTLAPLMEEIQTESLEDLSAAISDLNECQEGTEGQHWLAVGWALLDLEPVESEATT